ncbi:MAG: minor capsid protein [Clostridia bacterium]
MLRDRLLEYLIKWLRDFRFPAPRDSERTVEGYAEEGQAVGNWYGIEEHLAATPDNLICLVEGKAPNESPMESGYSSSRRVIQVICRSKTLITAKIRCQRIEEVVRLNPEVELENGLAVVKILQKPMKSGIDASGRFEYSLVLSVYADRGVS